MNRQDEFRRRHRERRTKAMNRMRPHGVPPARDYEGPHDRFSGWNDPVPEHSRPVFSGSRFLIQCFFSALLFSAAYWTVHQTDDRFLSIKKSVTTAMTQEFQFSAVSDWYEKNLGQPISFLPDIASNTEKKTASGHVAGGRTGSFAVPVNGEVKDRFNRQNNGITVETSPHSAVEAAKDGLVVFVGEKKKTGRTVIIQHKDSDESWYGKLDKIDVKVYDFVKQGQKIGTTSGTNQKGSFYFALKKGEKFIDPIQVMSFD
ncbi:M23 family metallopeptidase [Sporolactobacillus sp. THM7-4]|nr:M23 family metallopeptidase [Sporolactobacillus sp. THM7-4]